MSDIKIPENLKPSDPRFGCGPSKIRPAALQVLAGPGAKILGTSMSPLFGDCQHLVDLIQKSLKSIK